MNWFLKEAVTVRDDLEQQEQMDALRGFWRENRRWILSVFIVIGGGWAGYQGFLAWQSSRAVAATQMLERMEAALAADKLEEAEAHGLLLLKEHGSSTHASLAALRLARVHVASGALDKALPMLAHAANSSDEAVAWIARVRAATVLMDLDRLPEALQQLEGEPPVAALGVVQDRRGDVLSLMKRWDEARSAWEAAQKTLQANAEDARGAELVARKLASLDAFAQTGQ